MSGHAGASIIAGGFSRIGFGPVFVAVSRNGRQTTKDRLSDKHVTRRIKQCVRDAGLPPDLPEAERIRLYSGHSLRAGLASSAEVDERFCKSNSAMPAPK